MAANPEISELQTSQIYRVKGLKSLFYPDPNFTAENCADLENVQFTEKRTIDRRDGYVKFDQDQITESSSAQIVNGLFQANHKTHGLIQYITAGTKILMNNGTTRKNISVSGDALTAGRDNKTMFLHHADKIFGTNNNDAPWQHDGNYGSGSLATAVSGIPFTKALVAVSHRNFLVFLNTVESSVHKSTRVRWCDINKSTFTDIDVATWPSNHRYDVYEDGPAIITAADNFGRLLIFKADGLYPTRLEFNVGNIELTIDEEGIRRGFEPIATHSIVSRPEFTWVICRDGGYVVRPDMTVEHVTRDFTDAWDSLSKANLTQCVSFPLDHEHQIVTLIPSATVSNAFDQAMVWDWETSDIFIYKFTKEMNFGVRFINSDKEFYLLGSFDGYVYKAGVAPADNSNSDPEDDGTAIDWIVQMAPNDLGFPGRTKTVINLRTIVKTQSSVESISVSAIRNQGQLLARTGTITVGSTQAWDASGAEWDDGTSTWPGGTTETKNLYVNRTCETIAPRWAGDDIVGIIGYQAEFTLEE